MKKVLLSLSIVSLFIIGGCSLFGGTSEVSSVTFEVSEKGLRSEEGYSPYILTLVPDYDSRTLGVTYKKGDFEQKGVLGMQNFDRFEGIMEAYEDGDVKDASEEVSSWEYCVLDAQFFFIVKQDEKSPPQEFDFSNYCSKQDRPADIEFIDEIQDFFGDVLEMMEEEEQV